MRRGEKDLVEGFHALAVGQEQVDQDGDDALSPAPFVCRESRQALGTSADPLNLELARFYQRVADGLRVLRIVLNDEYDG
jgi:hypothetical protein